MKILLCVTGGIAAYKSLELCRLFIKAGHEVQVVMTEGAKAFIQPLSFQALSGKPVRDSLFDANQEAGMGHIELARWPDLILIAPATAETLAKLRMGKADDLLSTLVLASDKPVCIAPAMNRLMWSNAATQENVQVLKARGLEFFGPDQGEQACGEIGAGRMREPQNLFEEVMGFWAQKCSFSEQIEKLKGFWQGRRLLITAGPTFEDIDPVRFLGNRSSGKMGFAITQAAIELGAQVDLISGPVNIEAPPRATLYPVRSALQMFEQVQQHYQNAEVMISAAAVADFRSAKPADNKIKKQSNSETLTLELVKNPDIVAWVAQQSPKPYVVGFAAETQNVLEYAKTKLEKKNLDMICANQVGENLGFEQEQNQLTLITHSEQKALPVSSKSRQAFELLSFIATQIEPLS